ncbi:MAG: beta strand repeat-containing protein [Desulfitobacteriaceae bacterium]
MRKSKKTLAILAIIAMVFMMVPVQAFADTAAGANRLSGADRVGTAIAIANNGWATGASTVIVAPADDANLVDALAVAPLAGQLGAPILLTGKDGLDPQVQAELATLKATTVYAVGALSPAVIASLKAAAGVTVNQIQGADRFATAAQVAAKLTAPAGTFVVAYNGLADAMSAASYAAANNYAILIADTNGMLPASETVVGTKTYTVGGQVTAIAGATSLAGADRYATNDAVLSALTYKYDKVFVANGETLVDALAGAALAAKTGSPIVLANATGATAAAKVNANLTASSQVIAFGGTGVVSDAVLGSVVYTPPAVLAVSSVSAIDLNQVKVVFSQIVDKTSAQNIANYQINGVPIVAGSQAVLQSDNQTVLVTLNNAQSQYSSAVFTAKNVYASDNVRIVPSNSATLTFSDTAVPTVVSATASGNQSVKVVFSEPVLMDASFAGAAGSNFQIDGQAAANAGFSNATVNNATASNYATSITLNFAVALSAGQHTLTVPSGVIGTSLSDAAYFAVAKTTVNFGVNTVTNAPVVTGVTGQNNGTVYVTFNRGMDTTSAVTTLANYTIGTVNPTAAKFTDSTNTVVKLTFNSGVVAQGANVIAVNKNVKDSYGNALDPNNDVRVSFNATSDTTPPTVSSVVMISSTDLRVKFSETVNAIYANNTANYTLKDSSGTNISSNITAIAPVSPDANGNSDTYDVTVTALAGSQYTLKITNVQDLAATPNVMADYTATVTGNDTTAPTALDALQVTNSSKQVVVEYSEVMSDATIINAQNYAYQGEDGNWHALPTSTTVVSGNGDKNVTITFPTGYTVDYTGSAGAGSANYVKVIRVANVTDAAGNVLSGIAQQITLTQAALASTGPQMTAKSFTLSSNSTQVLATIGFDQPVTSLVKGDFTVAGKTPDSAYISGNNVVLVFTDTTTTTGAIAVIKAAGVNAAVATVSTTSTNAAGAPIKAIVATNVYNNQIAPKVLSAVASIGAKTVTITFSSPIDSGIQGLYTDDFTITQNGTVLTVNSALASGNTLTLNMSAVSASVLTVRANAATIDVRTLADGAGNNVKYVPSTTDLNGIPVTPGA